MSPRVQNALYTAAILLLIALVWYFRSIEEPAVKRQFTGATMGTSYTVSYFGDPNPDLKSSVDSLLVVFNQSLNTWNEDSEVSIFNREERINFNLPYFYPVLKGSERVYELSEGAFDPAVMPLVNAWGFGPDSGTSPDSTVIDSLMEFVGFDQIEFDEKGVSKSDARVQLDFSAIAKGFGVDIVSEFLVSMGYVNHFVEIGGEVNARGKNRENGKNWVIGITDPRSTLENSGMIATLSISDQSVATSGNYYNYRVRDGVKYSHTISPFTGYPIERWILSATVVTDNCMIADALATAFMVMGHEKAIEITGLNNDIEAFIIYSKPDGSLGYHISSGLKEHLKILAP